MSAPLYGLVLAGGESRRMGHDKALLRYHAAPQHRHVAALLALVAERVFLSNGRAGPVTMLPSIADAYASPTPLNGIVSAMEAFPGVAWLVAAVDMPGITRETLTRLVACRQPPATCFPCPAKGGPEPLLAIWEPETYRPLRDALLAAGTGPLCARGTLAALAPHMAQGATRKELCNINTPEERAAWLEAQA